MDAPPHHHHLKGVAAANEAEQIPPDPSNCHAVEDPKPRRRRNKNKKKKQALISDTVSSASSNNCSSKTSFSQKGFQVSRNSKRFRIGLRSADVDALGLPLGMSIAAVVSKVLERKGAAATRMPVEYLSEMCVSAVRESLGHVFGDKVENFVTNFEQSFRSTLRTLRLISDSSQNVEEQLQRGGFRGCSSSTTPICSSFDRIENSKCAFASTNGHDRPQCTNEHLEENMPINLMNQLVLHDKEKEQRLDCVSTRQSPSDTSINQSSTLSSLEKSIMEQTRSNDLKMLEIGIKMKELNLQERQLALSSESNSLERSKLSMGFSKASFKAEKFKTQLQDTREAELLKKCLDFLVAGLIIMLSSLLYGIYVYSHRKIIEATEACSPYTESKSSWWMPKSMATFNSGLQLLQCQIVAVGRLLSGVIMIGALTFYLVQRSATSHHTMPLTFLLILGFGCGFAGKFCIDTLGGSGYHWLIYWEVLCALHCVSIIHRSALYVIIHGPITVAEKVERGTFLPYWMRRSIFYAILLILPLLCGFMPFATPWEWFDHFASKTSDFFEVDD